MTLTIIKLGEVAVVVLRLNPNKTIMMKINPMSQRTEIQKYIINSMLLFISWRRVQLTWCVLFKIQLGHGIGMVYAPTPSSARGNFADYDFHKAQCLSRFFLNVSPLTSVM